MMIMVTTKMTMMMINSWIIIINKLMSVFLCFCPVIDHEFRHNIVKEAVNPQGDSRVDPQIVELPALARVNSCSYRKKCILVCLTMSSLQM